MSYLKILFSLISSFLIILYVCGCSHKKVSFSTQELKFINPFSVEDTIIYKSNEGKSDTIIFYKVSSQINSTRNLEQGFYDTYSYSVDYRLTIGSFHKIINPNEIGAKAGLYGITKSSYSPISSGQEFSFLGLIFDDKYLDSVVLDTSSTTLFDESKAEYKDVNINEGIKSFTFDKEKGIISFIDKNQNKWFRSGKN